MQTGIKTIQLIISAKNSISDVLHGSEYASALVSILLHKYHCVKNARVRSFSLRIQFKRG